MATRPSADCIMQLISITSKIINKLIFPLIIEPYPSRYYRGGFPNR